MSLCIEKELQSWGVKPENSHFIVCHSHNHRCHRFLRVLGYRRSPSRQSQGLRSPGHRIPDHHSQVLRSLCHDRSQTIHRSHKESRDNSNCQRRLRSRNRHQPPKSKRWSPKKVSRTKLDQGFLPLAERPSLEHNKERERAQQDKHKTREKHNKSTTKPTKECIFELKKRRLFCFGW